MLFVSISFALGSQRKRNFQWNMDLTDIMMPKKGTCNNTIGIFWINYRSMILVNQRPLSSPVTRGGGTGGFFFFLSFYFHKDFHET